MSTNGDAFLRSRSKEIRGMRTEVISHFFQKVNRLRLEVQILSLSEKVVHRVLDNDAAGDEFYLKVATTEVKK